VFLIYGSKITAASRGFPATARLSCYHSCFLTMGAEVLSTSIGTTSASQTYCSCVLGIFQWIPTKLRKQLWCLDLQQLYSWYLSIDTS